MLSLLLIKIKYYEGKEDGKILYNELIKKKEKDKIE